MSAIPPTATGLMRHNEPSRSAKTGHYSLGEMTSTSSRSYPMVVNMCATNRTIVEVRGGAVLFFNCRTKVDDGWWWGNDGAPLQHGPFASSDEARWPTLVATWESSSWCGWTTR
jgi:hypothetical protein